MCHAIATTRTKVALICPILVLSALLVNQALCDYRVGVGIADATAPVAEIVFIGYAKSSQKGSGLHLRQYARAFIIEDENKRVAFVSIDTAMVGHGIKAKVLENLEKRLGKTYNEGNLIISATHTHNTPGGAMMNVLFDISMFGFVRETFDALVSGITMSVIKAHESIRDAKIFLNSGELLNANINRSPLAYLLNPEEERERYNYNTDKEMVQLKFVSSSDSKPFGSIQWYPVHPTSLNNTNTLVSSGNVGYASILLEKHMNNGSLPGKGEFVGAFASTNLGDVSPNLRGPHCLNTGDPCEDITSSCDNNAKICIASGPGTDMYESCKIIGERLFEKALELLNDGKAREVTGPVKIGHQYVHMPSQVVEETLSNGTVVKRKGCLSAMGYSFAAGTTDGPGEFDFKQGTVSDNAFWNLVRNFLAKPTEEDIACHRPKPILVMTGRMTFPYEWQPAIVSVQAAIIGNVVLAAVPGEFTTMAGRRLKNAVKKVIVENGGSENSEVIICGLSNIYSDYIVTPEEYQLQRYEAASTIYGPNTLTIYTHLYSNLVNSLYKGSTIDVGPDPPDLSENLISFVTPVVFDWPGLKSDFGDCIIQPPSTVSVGDVVSATFVAGHPRNNVMHGKTFLSVERLASDDEWEVVATDANWETKFKWTRIAFISGISHATIEWLIEKNVRPGVYRIRHFGYYKYILGGTFPYEGMTDNFTVL